MPTITTTTTTYAEAGCYVHDRQTSDSMLFSVVELAHGYGLTTDDELENARRRLVVCETSEDHDEITDASEWLIGAADDAENALNEHTAGGSWSFCGDRGGFYLDPPEPDGYVCTDCLVWSANGEPNPDHDEDQHTDYLRRLAHRNIGGWLEPSCGDDDDEGFSWSPCEGCGSTLGGTRHAAYWVAVPEDQHHACLTVRGPMERPAVELTNGEPLEASHTWAAVLPDDGGPFAGEHVGWFASPQAAGRWFGLTAVRVELVTRFTVSTTHDG